MDRSSAYNTAHHNHAFPTPKRKFPVDVHLGLLSEWNLSKRDAEETRKHTTIRHQQKEEAETMRNSSIL